MSYNDLLAVESKLQNRTSIVTTIDACRNFILTAIENYYQINRKAISLYCSLIYSNPQIFDISTLNNLIYCDKEIDMLINAISDNINKHLETNSGEYYQAFRFSVDINKYKPDYKQLKETIKSHRETLLIKKVAAHSINSVFKKAATNLLPLPFIGMAVKSQNIGSKIVNMAGSKCIDDSKNELDNKVAGIIDNIRHSMSNDIYTALIEHIYKDSSYFRKEYITA